MFDDLFEKKEKKVESGAKKVKPAAKKEKPAPKAGKSAKKPATANKPQQKKAVVIIQSPMGGEITPEDILAKVGKAEKVYVRVDVKKAYWVNGMDSGAVDLW